MGTKSFPWREWLAAIVWLILIAIESTPWLSFQNTGHVLSQLVRWFFGPVNSSGVNWVNTALREVGHVTGYGVLSWLFFRALRATARAGFPAWALSWAVTAFFLTAAVASLDEWHQTILPSRTGSIHDVYLDSAAALAVQVLLFAFLRKRRRGAQHDRPRLLARATED
jgi:VanZ family protein